MGSLSSGTFFIVVLISHAKFDSPRVHCDCFLIEVSRMGDTRGCVFFVDIQNRQTHRKSWKKVLSK